jgi:chemotaxis methyl-accepting protein methylase
MPQVGSRKGVPNKVSFRMVDRMAELGMDVAAELVSLFNKSRSELVRLKCLEIMATYCFRKPGAINELSDEEFLRLLRAKIDERRLMDPRGERVIEGGGEPVSHQQAEPIQR